MSEFICREMTLDDRAKALEWLSTFAKNPFPDDLIPETGVSAVYNGEVYCILPIYLELTTNTVVFGSCMPNPGINAKMKHAAVECVVNGALRYAKNLGKKYVYALFGHRAFNRIADRIGFITADKNVEEKYCLIV